ncbi:MAG: hypothetical protein AB7O68_09560 [Pirellulales bacterium]
MTASRLEESSRSKIFQLPGLWHAEVSLDLEPDHGIQVETPVIYVPCQRRCEVVRDYIVAFSGVYTHSHQTRGRWDVSTGRLGV